MSPSHRSNDLAAALLRVHQRIEAAGGDPAQLTLVAVTKTLGQDAVDAALSVGICDIAENYAQELITKATQWTRANRADSTNATRVAPRWHFIGAIQRNKIKALAPEVSCWQSIARLSEGETIARHHPGAAVMVQVGAEDQGGRNGCLPEDVEPLVAQLRGLGLAVEGLMTVAPIGEEAAQLAFRQVRDLADKCQVVHRSMGMSDDLEVAVREGSTMLRLGRALFGDRQVVTNV